MRFLKFFIIAFIALFIILTITYSARVSIINHVAKEQLSLFQLKITCLDTSLASDMTIIVDKLCLQSPKADIVIVDMAIQWQYSPKVKVTDIDVRLADIKGTDHLFLNTNHLTKINNPSGNKQSKNNLNFNLLLSTTLRAYAENIKQFQLPLNINVADISYLPFTDIHEGEVSKKSVQQQRETLYRATISAVDNTLSFSLFNTEKIAFIKAKLTKNQEDFSISLSSKLALLRGFASAHKLPITAELQSALSTNKISGNLDSLIAYQPSSLSMKTQITDITLISNKGIGGSGAFKLLGALNFQSKLPLVKREIPNKAKSGATDNNNSVIALTFVGKNKLSLEYSQAYFFALLEESEVSPTIISILKDNPLTHLTLKLQDKSTFTLNDKKLSLRSIGISAGGGEPVHQVKLEAINLAFPDSNIEKNVGDNEKPSNQTPYALAVESFVIDSQVKLANLARFTTEPVAFHLEGSLNITDKKTVLNLTENSSITAHNIVVLKPKLKPKLKPLNKAKKNVTAIPFYVKNTKERLSLKTLTATLEGSGQLLEDSVFSVNLKVHNRATQVNIPETLQLKSFDVFSEIKGNLDDIHINATVLADEIDLGSLVMRGPALSPKVKLAANKLQLTDLLSLNVQLPIKVELIDGLLDYNISAHLADLSHIENTPFDVSVAVTSASGEVDGLWLQELNWQQNFTLLAGKITTEPNTSENLTVALIDTPTPITKLSINTNWTFNKSFKLSASKLKADALGGSFYIPKLQWPFEQGHSVNVQLTSIDLEQVLALDKKQGIVVTGNISGQIPVTFDGEKYIVEKGELYNISDGLIQVSDNPAVAELKANNSQLQLAFDALQNLHYHQLSSVVSMADDGYMLLETVIKGRNPDIDNDVNLNLNLSYDLLGLLESLAITEQFEQGIIKGLQKKKE